MFHCIVAVARDTNDAVSRLPGADGGNRTHCTVIKSHVPYRLATSAYGGVEGSRTPVQTTTLIKITYTIGGFW